MNELNKKLAEWRGFVDAHKGIEGKTGISYWYPRGVDDFYNRKSSLPDFTKSLDACEKWLFPKLLSASMSWVKGLRFMWIIELDVDHRYEGLAETSALALCLAIEKLIDGEK